MEAEQIGIAILRIKEVEKISICDAADKLFANLTTSPSEAQNPQVAPESRLTLAGPEALNGA
jgi:hypothetical protein